MPKELTVDEFLKDYEKKNPGMYNPSELTSKSFLKDFAKKFAKAHRTNILQTVKDKVKVKTMTYGSPDESEWSVVVDKDTIDLAYPENLIK